MPDNNVNIVACPHPFRTERVNLSLPAGGNIRDMLAACNAATPYAHVYVDDELIDPECWERVFPQPGAMVVVRVVPGKSGGGKDVLRIVLSIAVIALSAWTYGASLKALGPIWAGTLAASVSVAGTLAVNALIPPPTSGAGSAAMGDALSFSPVHSITGSRNQANPYGVIPRPYGTHRLFPPPAAKPYTELHGSTQYLRMLFCLGYAPLEMTELKIGETAIDQFDYVTYQRGISDVNPPTLFMHDVNQVDLSILFPSYTLPAGVPDHSGIAWETRTTDLDVDRITVEFTAPQGLIYIRTNARRGTVTVYFDIEYSVAGADIWEGADAWRAGDTDGAMFYLAAGKFKFQGSTGSLRRCAVSWDVPTGQYDVRIRRTAIEVEWNPTEYKTGGIQIDGAYVGGYTVPADPSPWSTDGQNMLRDDVYWSVLRNWKTQLPVSLPGVELLAVRIKATDELNGIVDTLSCVVQSYLDVWNGSAWVSQLTNNPAWAYVDALTGTANKRAKDKSRLDADEILAWADDCDTKGYEFNAVIDGKITVKKLCQLITATGRATPAKPDGKYSVVRDIPQSSAAQPFTPRNSWGFRGSKKFVDLPHALEIEFRNKNKDYQVDKITVYDDGYSAANATKFESMQWTGVTDPDQAWRMGRYHIAVARLRPETYELYADVEHIVCTRGDLVRVSHDVPLWGSGWGRIKAIAGQLLTFDEAFSVEDGKIYVVRIRTDTGASVLVTVTHPGAGEYTALTVVGALTGVKKGDLCMFGEQNLESVECIVKAIHPGPDLSARLVLVDAAPAVHDAETGPIPPFDSQITEPIDREALPPPIPVIDSAVSDESVMVRAENGALIARLSVSFHLPVGSTIVAAGIEAQHRISGSDTWETLPPFEPDDGSLIIAPVQEEEIYEVRLRSRSMHGVKSAWSGTLQHTVIGKTAPPLPVQGFNAALEDASLTFNPMLQLFWDALNLIDLAEYELRYGGTDWASATPIAKIKATSHLVPVTWAGGRTFRIAATDTSGNGGGDAGNAVSLVFTIAVPSVSAITADVIDNNVLIKWSGSPGSLPILEYEIRKGADFDTAEVIGRKRGTFTTVFEVLSGEYRYWVVPVDTAGNYGTPKSLTALVDEPPDYILNRLWVSDFNIAEAETLTLNGEALTLNGEELTFQKETQQLSNTLVLSDGTAIAPFNVGQTLDEWLTAEGLTGNDTLDNLPAGEYLAEPVPLTAEVNKAFDYGGILAASPIKTTLDFDAKNGGPTIQYFLSHKQAELDDWATNEQETQSQFGTDFRYVRDRFFFTSDGHQFAHLHQHTVRLDAKKKTQPFSGTITNATTGAVVSIPSGFLDITGIEVTAGIDSAGGDTVESITPIYDFEDIPNPTQFIVYLFDSAGNKITGKFSGTISGY